MLIRSSNIGSPVVAKARNIFFVLLGVAGLLLKRHYIGPHDEIIHSYGGNLTVSFAVYFVLTHLPFQSRSKRLLTAALGLGVVELFEAFDGFGVMTNVYDPIDFFVNAVGIGIAWALDAVLAPKSTRDAKAESHATSQSAP